MQKFITVRMWEETKEKLERVRIDKSMKEKRNLQKEALLIILNASSFNGVI